MKVYNWISIVLLYSPDLLFLLQCWRGVW